MSIFSQINEAADIPLDQIKAAMKKDKRVSKIFTANLTLDEIAYPAEFISTLKYYLFNNHNALAFAKSVVGNGAFSNFEFKNTRKMIADKLSQADVDELVRVVKLFFKELSVFSTSKMTNDAQKELHNWVNTKRRPNMNSYLRKEIDALPGLKPEKPIVLYRGLAFSNESLKERDVAGDGTLTAGEGLQFLRSVRAGEHTIDLSWEFASSWTTDPKRAMSFALLGRNAASLRDDEMPTKLNEKYLLGFLISTRADPKDIIIDFNRYAKVSKWSGETDLVILKSGKYLCRVVKKFNRHGEVDPIAPLADEKSDLAVLHDSLDLFNSILKVPVPEMGFNDVPDMIKSSTGDVDFRTLLKPGLKEKLERMLEMVRGFYEETIKPLNIHDLLADVGSSKLGKTARAAIDTDMLMRLELYHPSRIDKSNWKTRAGAVERHELTGKEQHEAWSGSSYNGLLDNLRNLGSRISNYFEIRMIRALAERSGKIFPDNLHHLGAKNQEEVKNVALDEFFKLAELPKPENRLKAIDEMQQLLLLAERNHKAATFLWNLKDVLSKI